MDKMMICPSEKCTVKRDGGHCIKHKLLPSCEFIGDNNCPACIEYKPEVDVPQEHWENKLVLHYGYEVVTLREKIKHIPLILPIDIDSLADAIINKKITLSTYSMGMLVAQIDRTVLLESIKQAIEDYIGGIRRV